MNKLSLQQWETRPYGERSEGSVSANDRTVHVTVRRPTKPAPVSTIYVMANGWTAGRNSMRTPAIEAARNGHTAVTFEYTNTGSHGALLENVRDVNTIVNALPRGERKAAIGLSMGGAVVTMALEDVGGDIDSATLVAPGKYLRSDYYSIWKIARHAIAEASEAAQLGGHVLTGSRLMAAGVANCARRPQAVTAELIELLTGNVHDEIRRVKAQPDAPYVRFMYGLHDRLLPASAQADSIRSLPFDEVLDYDGGHAQLAYDPKLANRIFQLDDQVRATATTFLI